MKRLTIPCDRCGARIHRIPKKCPTCGELLAERMDPYLYKRIKKKLTPKPALLTSPAGIITIIIILMDAVALCLLHWMNSDKGFGPLFLFLCMMVFEAVITGVWLLVLARRDFPITKTLLAYHSAGAAGMFLALLSMFA